MSSKKNAKPKLVLQRMKDMHISERQIAQYVMHPVKDISEWLLGKRELPYTIVWKICDLLEAL